MTDTTERRAPRAERRRSPDLLLVRRRRRHRRRRRRVMAVAALNDQVGGLEWTFCNAVDYGYNTLGGHLQTTG